MKLNLSVTKLLSTVFVLSALLLLVVIDHPAVYAAVSVTRAELDRGRLRIEGEGAMPDATMSVDGVVGGNADDRGRFKIELEDFSSSSCQVTISDGNSSQVVSLDPCSDADPPADEPPAPPVFAALEVELLEEPLSVPAILHQSPPLPVTNNIPVPAGLPDGSIVEFLIEGVVSAINGARTEWKIGSDDPELLVYPSAATRFDKNPEVGDLVRILGVRTVLPGPIVADRITQRAQGPLPVGPAAVEIGFLFSGVFTSEDDGVLTIGGFRFAVVELPEPTEILAAEGDTVVVVFVEAAGLVPVP